MSKFIPGLKLSKLFYQKEVRPILNQEFPKLRHSAALIGWGSEVLSFDTCLSRDHHWGPRVLLFLSDRDYAKLKEKIGQALSDKLRGADKTPNHTANDKAGGLGRVAIGRRSAGPCLDRGGVSLA